MISVKNAVSIHAILIDKYGGKVGVRDQKLLESALSRPYQTFDKKELYKSPIEKAASLIESLINNHPFIDGNKRFGYVAMRLTLLEHGLDINATQTEKYEFVISIAKGDLKFEGICSWISLKQK